MMSQNSRYHSLSKIKPEILQYASSQYLHFIRAILATLKAIKLTAIQVDWTVHCTKYHYSPLKYHYCTLQYTIVHGSNNYSNNYSTLH